MGSGGLGSLLFLRPWVRCEDVGMAFERVMDERGTYIEWPMIVGDVRL